MFQFRRFPSYTYFIQYMMHMLHTCGLLHSDICGSIHACWSPQLFAAYHVLLRLLMPRHSPCALISLTIWIMIKFSSFYRKQTLIYFPLAIIAVIPDFGIKLSLIRLSHISSFALLSFLIQFSSYSHDALRAFMLQIASQFALSLFALQSYIF